MPCRVLWCGFSLPFAERSRDEQLALQVRESTQKMNICEANVRNKVVQFEAGQELLRHQHDSETKLEREKHQREIDALKHAARIAEQESTQRALGKATRQ